MNCTNSSMLTGLPHYILLGFGLILWVWIIRDFNKSQTMSKEEKKVLREQYARMFCVSFLLFLAPVFALAYPFIFGFNLLTCMMVDHAL